MTKLRAEQIFIPADEDCDDELYRACLPSLASSHGKMFILSSPYRKAGLVFNLHREHYGRNSPSTLIVQADSLTLNPNLDASKIDKARQSDAESAAAEWDGLFRSDLAAFLDPATIERAVGDSRGYDPRYDYTAFVDASGGSDEPHGACVPEQGRPIDQIVEASNAG